MSPGIQATVEFHSSAICPIADLSKTAETAIDSVSATVCSADCSECVTEFVVEGDHEPDGDVRPVFSHGSTHRYRLVHDEGITCPCECLGSFGCVVDRYVARDGTLRLVFHAEDYTQLQDVIGELRDRFPDTDVKRLIRSPSGNRTRDTVFVDRNRLTDRQREVLHTAFDMGYFEQPRRANAATVSSKLGIGPSTFSEHLAAAQTKLFEDVFEERS